MAVRLPIHEILPELMDVLAQGSNAVLVAPPGAGKSTAIPLALLDAAWTQGKRIIMLSPRRIAVRSAAARMAEIIGEQVGQTVGYRVRMENKVSSKTRIEVMTEGVFLRRIIADPELLDVAIVLFDEFHERSLEADLSLALALDSRSGFRPDLRLMPMSATLDDQRLPKLLAGHVVRSEGRMFPVDTFYLGRRQQDQLEVSVAAAVQLALRDQLGGILVFLPGQREIAAVADRLANLGPDIALLTLHGGLDVSKQDVAVRELKDGRRKVVLATAIAETSLTIPDIRVVIDSGLSRVPKFDPAVGLTRLVTERATLSSIEQRRGRAGRLEKGVAYRLWDEPETRGLKAFPVPQILDADLTSVALVLADWGVENPDQLAWLDPPSLVALRSARMELTEIGALADGRLTEHGRRILLFPTAPKLAHMIISSQADEEVLLAVSLAVLISERGLGGKSIDLRQRLTRLGSDKSKRLFEARKLVTRMADILGHTNEVIDVERAGFVLARAWPDRLAKALNVPGRYQMANGRQAWLEETDPLANEKWLLIADGTGHAAGARILAAAPIKPNDAESLMQDNIKNNRIVIFDKASGDIRVRTEKRFGRITINSQPESVTFEDVTDGLRKAFEAHGLSILPWSQAVLSWRARASFLFPEKLDERALVASAASWLPIAVGSAKGISGIRNEHLLKGLKSLLNWDDLQRLEIEAPDKVLLSNGRTITIDYSDPNGPATDVVIQELFGVISHPTISGKPLLIRLLSPARRPQQTTRDLPGFWTGSYTQVRAELRGRYPKHSWPEDPRTAKPPKSRTRHS